MDIRQRVYNSLLGVLATILFANAALANGTLIAWYKMGEQEGGTNNGLVSSTLDSPVGGGDTFGVDLNAANSPVYRTISGRPDGGTGIGIQFTGASSQSLATDPGYALNWPEDSPWATDIGGPYNLDGISDRSFQLWVRPTSTAAQSIVMDTNEHGVRIDASGKFSMRYGGVDFPSTLSAVANTWYHIQVVRPDGYVNGSRMYINGNAVAIGGQNDDYAEDHALPLTVGSNVTRDGEFFNGVVDDLRMQVYGTTDPLSSPATNYGAFNFLTDNAFVASPISGLKGIAGDVNNDGSLTQTDKDAFIAGWLHKRLVNGVQIGDMASHGEGDLNFDGITNLQDLLVMQNALHGAGIGSISASDLSAVPEPATIGLLLSTILTLSKRKRRP